MNVSVRSQLGVGVATLAASVIALSPVPVPLQRDDAPLVAPHVDLAASVKPLVIEPLSPEQVATARAAIERIDPEAQLPVQVAAVPAPAPLNAASDAIVAGYQFIQYWVDYGVELADYVLGFIPYGYLIGDQVEIVYFNLVRPISDSVVYGLIVPVVNDPLNIWSWVNGASVVGQTVVNALINTGIAEFNYFFGWLIPPLPPLPLAATEETALTTTLAMAEVTAEPAALGEDDALAAAVEPDAETTDAEAAPKPVDAEPASAESPTAEAIEETTEVADEPVAPEPEADEEKDESTTTTSAGGVRAQGEVRGGGDDKDAKPAEENKPDAAKGGDNADSTTAKPADSDAGDAGAKGADAGTDATKTKD